MQGEGQHSGSIKVKETPLCSVSGLDRTLSALLSKCAPNAAARMDLKSTQPTIHAVKKHLKVSSVRPRQEAALTLPGELKKRQYR